MRNLPVLIDAVEDRPTAVLHTTYYIARRQHG